MSKIWRMLPQPRHVRFDVDELAIEENRLIQINSSNPEELFFAARKFQRALFNSTSTIWQIYAGKNPPRDQIGLALLLIPGEALHPQGYHLEITDLGIKVTAHDEVGIYYGICTLIQILESSKTQVDSITSLPYVSIEDWPDFLVRGVMLDISRDKVPTMETLYNLVDMFSGWKINQLQLYTEHTFSYRNHSDVWNGFSPLTGEEILELDTYCRDRFIELVPVQQSGGHMHRWLIHDRYASLAETHDTFTAPWGERIQGPFSLCPTEPRSIELLQELYDDLLPHFTSSLFNVCCDEMTDLGFGKSKPVTEKIGVGRVYVDYINKIYEEVKSRGCTMQFWGDMIVKYPELISDLPQDIIVLLWGYEKDHPYDEQCNNLASSNIPFYVCPGTSSWGSLAGRTDNAIHNLLNSAEAGIEYGAIGYLNTDWGDCGHWQVLPISYLGFVAGAAYSWSLAANRDLDIKKATSWHAFRDLSGSMGQVSYDLGNIYKEIGFEPFSSSALFWILIWPHVKSDAFPEYSKANFENVEERVNRALEPLANASMERPDADLIKEEFLWTALIMRHACKRGELLKKAKEREDLEQVMQDLDYEMERIITDFTSIWLCRNRPGGLKESVKRLEMARELYKNENQPSSLGNYYLSSRIKKMIL